MYAKRLIGASSRFMRQRYEDIADAVASMGLRREPVRITDEYLCQLMDRIDADARAFSVPARAQYVAGTPFASGLAARRVDARIARKYGPVLEKLSAKDGEYDFTTVRGEQSSLAAVLTAYRLGRVH